jgi:hypothetical protein
LEQELFHRSPPKTNGELDRACALHRAIWAGMVWSANTVV